MTCTLHCQLALSGSIFTACATSRSVITFTRLSACGSVTSLPSFWYLPISCAYARRDELIACSSETSISCLRPLGLVAQAATSSTSAVANSGLRQFILEPLPAKRGWNAEMLERKGSCLAARQVERPRGHNPVRREVSSGSRRSPLRARRQ
jgi:hypothetical protein